MAPNATVAKAGHPGRKSARRRVTMTDVAELADCSQSTVSLVLSGKPDVKISAATRRRVIESAKSLGYRYRRSPLIIPPGKARRSPGEPAGAGSGNAAAPAANADMAGRGYASSSAARSHTSQVMHEIGAAIVSGRYAQNAILPGDAELIARFGVSRTVLREAMKTLSGKGLLHAKARIGTRVRERSEWNLFDADVLIWHATSGFDATFIAHLGEMRLALEPAAASLAAQRRSDGQIAELYRCVDRMGAPGVSQRGFVDADLDFHLTVATAAGNPFFKSISTLIEVALVASLTRSWPGDEPQGTSRSVADHRAIADAIALGAADDASAAMRKVIMEGIARSSGRLGRT